MKNRDVNRTYNDWTRGQKIGFWSGAAIGGMCLLPLLPLIIARVVISGKGMTNA